MVFTQPEFIVFFAIVLAAVWTMRRWRGPHNQDAGRYEHALLLVASYYFYAYWDYRFCGLLIFSTALDYNVAKQIERCRNPTSRKRWLIVSISINLWVLGFFKYVNFAIDSILAATSMVGMVSSSELAASASWNVVLPVGISFFTFQTMSYTIDVYRGNLPACRRPLQFALYVAFFPQLVAGPIVRATELLPQIASSPRWSRGRFYGGMMQTLRGVIKKVLIADRLAEMVDVVFVGPELYNTPTLWIAALAYSGQIYYDFSGYTDIAIGVAKMLGFRFPANFRHPYIACNIADFWHRWHITLSRWLRDYLYIPLGGSRHGDWQTRRNLLLTMLLGGLWHGASWTFVLWGAWHAVLLIVQRMFATRVRIPPALAWSATMLCVTLGWILFRSPSIVDAATYWRGMFAWQDGIRWCPPLVAIAIGCGIAEHVFYCTRARRWMRLPAGSRLTPIAVTIAIWTLLTCSPRGFQPFVYFQF